ncbi:MAG TPA: hypothetical protein DD381_09235 [Lentisphaeria bacterium]|nr:MAG: hypothetical protein A2X47_13570 [Lentisphaerae bacterium GWF2_38_69]HBM16506.1 hypothetical protein [Lentisphaeria bacterium]
MRSIEGNQPIDTESLYQDGIEGKDLSLEMYLLEKGRISQLEGNYKESLKAFNGEIDLLKERELNDDTLPGADINAGSVLVNDNLLPYKARLFEIEMLRLYQAYNYLALGSMEGALVEVRISDYLMREAEKNRNLINFQEEKFRTSETAAYKKTFENQSLIESGKLENDYLPQGFPDKSLPANDLLTRPDETELYLATEPIDNPYNEYPASSDSSHENQNYYFNQIEDANNQSFEDMKDILSKANSSILNPYILYVSGVLHEMNGENDDAYISYKQALLLMPENPYFRQDTIRLAIISDKEYDLEKLKSAYPQDYMQVVATNALKNKGRLVVLYEEGWAPGKEQKFISLGAFAIAYPIYNFTWNEPAPLVIDSETGLLGTTSPACYMGAMALRALQEESKWRIIRQSARAAFKAGVYGSGVTAAAVGTASDNSYMQAAGLMTMLLSQAYNNLSENADLRSWMTLPGNAQIMSKHLPNGEYKLVFSPHNSDLQLKERVVISENKTTILWVVKVANRMIYKCLWPSSTVNQ